jgi:hypothetical protein
MDNTPKTRVESKKNQKQKGRPDRLGSSKAVRQYEALMERKGGSVKGGQPNSNTTNNQKQK